MAGATAQRYVLAFLFCAAPIQRAHPPQGSQLLLTVVDSAGNTGGFTGQFYDVVRAYIVSSECGDSLTPARSWKGPFLRRSCARKPRRR